jgi:hypothetical protein
MWINYKIKTTQRIENQAMNIKSYSRRGLRILSWLYGMQSVPLSQRLGNGTMGQNLSPPNTCDFLHVGCYVVANKKYNF